MDDGHLFTLWYALGRVNVHIIDVYYPNRLPVVVIIRLGNQERVHIGDHFRQNEQEWKLVGVVLGQPSSLAYNEIRVTVVPINGAPTEPTVGKAEHISKKPQQ